MEREVCPLIHLQFGHLHNEAFVLRKGLSAADHNERYLVQP